MGEPTPFHQRTFAASKSLLYKEWAGYYAPRRYETCHEHEYHALRHAAGLMDVTPLYKYDLTGPDAQRLLRRVVARDAAKLAPGRITYCCWCEETGHVIDDGTMWHIAPGRYRLTSANPSLRWLESNSHGMQVEIRDTSREVAALALQGPTSRDILVAALGEAVAKLRFFGLAAVRFEGQELVVTRTGYTGDLGYELWVGRDAAVALWDRLVEAGRPHGLVPVGLDALDMTRIEAGFVLIDTDFKSSRHAMIPDQLYTPYEIGLGWTVDLGSGGPDAASGTGEKRWFVGREALERERAKGSRRQVVGLELDWPELERLYERWDLPPRLAAEAWRGAVPVYAGGWGSRQVGKGTSGTWSPLLKRYLVLATVKSRWAAPGTRLSFEVTVEGTRQQVGARVVPRPFFDPERKKK